MDYARNYIAQLQHTLGYVPVDLINQVILLLHEARMEGRKIFIMGNGGSASTASHFAADLAKNTRQPEWPDFRVIALNDNMAALSAYANDEGYENVFSQQLATFVDAGDVVIGISTSGNSANILRAVDLANQVGARTIGFTGFNGGVLSSLVDINLHVPSDVIEQVEDMHLMFEHMIVKSTRDQVGEIAGVHARLKEQTLLPAAWMAASVAKRNPSLELLYPISRRLTGNLVSPELLSRTLQASLENVGGASGAILRLDERGEPVEAVLAYEGQVVTPPAARLVDTLQHGLAGWVVENRQAALVANTRSDPRWLPRAWDTAENLTRSAVSVPLLERDRVSGVLTLVEKQAGQFSHEHLVLLAAIGVFVSFRENQAGGLDYQPVQLAQGGPDGGSPGHAG